ncbi:helix-turn-helix domain-containing protein [Carnobacterium antarcticum]|uniref:Helix-turn-helix domain-containing protein n=1 Tax=Carnobacterium antarcticum TaxID=2126436 RepID=A0ABW4NPB7_9LACT|nr:helix-turn-helix domain-containing protein [Carnobacterium sp. CP1]ALV20771.1 hypothetical protein NY10_146 [Carnobacterium sp. CP1]
MTYRPDRRYLNVQQGSIAAQRDRENKIVEEATAKKFRQIEDKKIKKTEEKFDVQNNHLRYTLWTKQVAEILGININKVRDLIDKNQLVATKAGRYWRVNEESVIEYKNRQNN